MATLSLYGGLYFGSELERILSLVFRAIWMMDGFPALAVALAVLLIGIATEWNIVLNHRRIDRMPLSEVERFHPRLPSTTEIVMTSILTIAFALLFFQFASRVYAMTFTLYWTSTESKLSREIIVADLDGDGDLDHLVFNNDATDTDKADVYLNASGNFSHNGTAANSYGNTNTEAADIDGDGDIDFVYTYINFIALLTNNGGGSFSINSIGGNIGSDRPFTLGDVDNDGDIDIIGAPSDYPDNQHSVRLNDGTGTFSAELSTLPSANFMAAADFDSDGILDLAIASPNTPAGIDFSIYRGSGTGAFAPLNTVSTISSGSYELKGIDTVDMDNDGDIDLMISVEQTSASYGYVYFYENSGAGVFTEGSAFQLDADKTVQGGYGDLDNDGDFDFISSGTDIAGIEAGTQVWMNDGSGNFTENGTSPHPTTCTNGVAIADIDSDGDLDYLVANKGCAAGGQVNRQYNSDQAATSANTAPSAPSASSMTGAMIVPSPRSGGTFSDDTSVGTMTWSGLSNVAIEDGVAAYAGSMAPGQISHYLKATNFGFNLPTGVTVSGIKVEVKKKMASGLTIQDYRVRLMKGGVIQSTDKSEVGDWPASYTYSSYGNASDLWSNTWSVSDINSSNFGFALAAIGGVGSGGGAEVDHIRITVYYSNRDIRLRWGSGSDTQTPTRSLQYQVRVGTVSNGNDIVSGASASPNWVRSVLPNGQSKTLLLKNLDCNQTYYWNVAAVDSGFKSTWGTEQSFSLDSSCGLTSGGGGSGGGSSTAGGGLPWNVMNQGGRTDSDSTVKNGILSVSAWKDINADGIHQKSEPSGFKGLSVTASGASVDGNPVRKIVTLSERGEGVFDLPPSDSRGYTVFIETGSDILKGFTPTTELMTGSIVLRSGQKRSLEFGFVRSDLLKYKPCLEIGEPIEAPTGDTEAGKLMIRLRDIFGTPVIKGAELHDSLVSRRQFFTLLHRTQCMNLERDFALLEPRIRIRKSIDIPLLDVPFVSSSVDASLIYTMIAEGFTVWRMTPKGVAGDLSSPVSRREAIQTVFEFLSSSPAKNVDDIVLPVDLAPDDELVPAYQTLHVLGILPESFKSVLGANQGVDPAEAMTMLVRAAFRNGKIPLTVPSLDPSVLKTFKKAPRVPTFLAEIPTFKVEACLYKKEQRKKDFAFRDLLPGDRLTSDATILLERAVKNTDDKQLWLLPGTIRPTEFGVDRGLSSFNISETPSVLETLRSLLILSCLPPYTPSEALKNSFIGSKDSKIPRDKISNLPRDTSYASRVMYRAQDAQREFNLSLTGFAPDVLRKQPRSPASPLSVDEASSLLASALLRMAVLQKNLTPQEAEGKVGPLRIAIAKDLLGTNLNWRDEGLLARTMFTREMLITYLVTVVEGRMSVSTQPEPSSVSLGEIWWERVQ